MIGSGVNLVMTVIGFAVSTMFIVFICTRLICARIQLSASRRSSASPNAAAAGSAFHHLTILERGAHGLVPIVVSSFPTKKFAHKTFYFGEDTQCTVCLAEYEDKDVLRTLPYCGHAFHVNCIDIWLQQHSTCPVCRISLRDSAERKHLMQPMYSAPIQSAYTPENFSSGSYHYLCGGNEYSTITIENQRMESIQECQHIPEASESGETGSTVIEVGHGDKDACLQESELKHVESPSNL